MSMNSRSMQVIVGEPEVVEDALLAPTSDAWLRLKAAATAVQGLQVQDGSIPPSDESATNAPAEAYGLVSEIIACLRALAPAFLSKAA